MRKPTFKALIKEMRVAGFSRRQIQRTVDELQDHFLDIVSEAMEAGKSSREAAVEAKERLGSDKQIANAILAIPELRSWASRHADILRPVQLLVLAPLMPIIVCFESGETISRWIAAACISALITASMFLSIQILIMIG